MTQSKTPKEELIVAHLIGSKVKGVNSRLVINSIEQAAAYSTVEINMRPGGISEYSKECKYLLPLFRTECGPTGWGISEEVVIDSRTGTPYWIVTLYDGQIAANTWYLEKKKLSFNEVAEYANDVSQELYEKVRGMNSTNWKQVAEALRTK